MLCDDDHMLQHHPSMMLEHEITIPWQSTTQQRLSPGETVESWGLSYLDYNFLLYCCSTFLSCLRSCSCSLASATDFLSSLHACSPLCAFSNQSFYRAINFEPLQKAQCTLPYALKAETRHNESNSPFWRPGNHTGAVRCTLPLRRLYR